MSSLIKLTESCNKILVETAVLTWTGPAVLIIYTAKSSQTITLLNIIEGKKDSKTILSLLILVHQDLKKIVFALRTSLSQGFVLRILQQYQHLLVILRI